MKLKIGDKVRVTYKRGHGNNVIERRKIGEIMYLNTRFIVVKFKNHKESFCIADIVAPIDKVLEVRKNEQWTEIERKMLK